MWSSWRCGRQVGSTLPHRLIMIFCIHSLTALTILRCGRSAAIYMKSPRRNTALIVSNPSIVCLVPTRSLNYFNFLALVTKRSVEFRHLTQNPLYMGYNVDLLYYFYLFTTYILCGLTHSSSCPLTVGSRTICF